MNNSSHSKFLLVSNIIFKQYIFLYFRFLYEIFHSKIWIYISQTSHLSHLIKKRKGNHKNNCMQSHNYYHLQKMKNKQRNNLYNTIPKNTIYQNKFLSLQISIKNKKINQHYQSFKRMQRLMSTVLRLIRLGLPRH